MFTKHGPYHDFHDNRNITMIFVTLSLILKNFSLGQVGMPKFNVLVLLSLTHVIANCLNLKYIRRAVMAEWLTHLTKDAGVPGSSLSRSQLQTFHPWMFLFGHFSCLLQSKV